MTLIPEKTDWDIFKGTLLKHLTDAFPEAKINWYDESESFGSAKIYVLSPRGTQVVYGYLRDDILALRMGVYAYAKIEADRIAEQIRMFEESK